MIFAILALLIIHGGASLIHWSLTGAQPAITTSVSAGITASDTTIPVNSITGFPSDSELFINGEVISYTGATGTCPAPFAAEPACFTGATRGVQQTSAISHAIGSRVYSEFTGTANDLIGVEQRTSIDELGDVTTPWGAGQAIVRFMTNTSTWDWLFCFSEAMPLCMVGHIVTIALNMGIFIALAVLLVSAIRTVRP